ncbi:MAG: biosynthetic peptidoglycan transglycosylase [Kofleriaceae bacterium]
MASREHATLAATAILAIGVPVGAAAWVAARTEDLADQIGTAGGVPARIGTIDASLTGSIRLTDVAFGDLVSAEAVEGSVGMGSLLDGQLRADEIVVEGPRVAIRVDPDGDSDLARLARRLAARRTPQSGASGGGHVRRIVVAGGTLKATIAGVGELAADGVELVPDGHGIRVVTGPVRIAGERGHVAARLAFERSAADLAFPQMRFGRVLAVAGTGSITTGAQTITLRDLAAGRRAAGAALEIRAAVDDAGTPRTLAVDVSPTQVALHGDRIPLRALASFAPHGIDVSDAHATGSLTIRRADTLEVSVDGTLDRVAIDHRSVTAEPLSISGGVRADVSVSADAIAMTRGALVLGDIELGLTGWVRRGAPASGQLDLQLTSAPCRALLASLPEPLRGPLDGMALAGALGGRARLAVDLAAPAGDGATLTSALAGDCRVTAEPPAADVATLTAASEQQLADGSRVRVGPGEPTWAALRGLPGHVSGAFVSAEDGRFYEHGGFDLVQIAHSLEIDLREHRLARGGSTISQQLVKNAFLTQRRSFDRKLQEAILTWRLEARLDKKQILERYLNVIELGPRIWGIGAAARYWFGVTPRELSVKQAAFLAALTSQPASMSRRVRRAGGLDPDSAERVSIVLRAMRRDGAISDEAYLAARSGTLYFAPTAVPAER